MLRSQKRYLQGFGICVVLLGILRAMNPEWGITTTKSDTTDTIAVQTDTNKEAVVDTDPVAKKVQTYTDTAATVQHKSIFCDETPHRIYSVPSYANTFPDINDLQIVSAKQYGIDPIHQEATAMNMSKELVYVGESPYYDVARLRASAPYLVPRAAVLLQDIGRAYYDSLQVKRIPLHRFIVTSLLRTREHVDKLRRHNGNATENSCHLYATTFDISYNRYNRVVAPGSPELRPTRSDSLKWVLSEVLRDMREQGRCHVKYEVKQGCFHITVK